MNDSSRGGRPTAEIGLLINVELFFHTQLNEPGMIVHREKTAVPPKAARINGETG